MMLCFASSVNSIVEMASLSVNVVAYSQESMVGCHETDKRMRLTTQTGGSTRCDKQTAVLSSKLAGDFRSCSVCIRKCRGRYARLAHICIPAYLHTYIHA
jgi:hypothetical protein